MNKECIDELRQIADFMMQASRRLTQILDKGTVELEEQNSLDALMYDNMDDVDTEGLDEFELRLLRLQQEEAHTSCDDIEKLASIAKQKRKLLELRRVKDGKQPNQDFGLLS